MLNKPTKYIKDAYQNLGNSLLKIREQGLQKIPLLRAYAEHFKTYSKRHPWIVGSSSVVLVVFVLWLFCLPRDLFADRPYSTVVVSSDGQLLGARIADDGQWRFPMMDSLPEKYVKAVVEYEDRNFYHHYGVSPTGVVRAMRQNFENSRVVSGASTITMQVIRLSRQNSRTYTEKLIEMFLATRLEIRYSKEDILRLYATHAPFGGNVVGLKAAMWRYFGVDNMELSWAQAATLAVLQNAPSSIHLSKNRDKLLAKRDRLLTRLMDKGDITAEEYYLALDEPLIDKPFAMPQTCPHLVEHFNKIRHGQMVKTDIDIYLQKHLEELTTNWAKEYRQRGINDLSVVVMDVNTLEPIAYIGNSDMDYERNGRWVDVARHPRSSGSVLKPLLYCSALTDGYILQKSILLDVPTNFGGFSPKNFDGNCSGAVSADKALASSLNIPFVDLLRQYRVQEFIPKLQAMGLTTFHSGNGAKGKGKSRQYGLSLILGGNEIKLIDVVQAYARMSHEYMNYSHHNQNMETETQSRDKDKVKKNDSNNNVAFPLTDPIALYYTFEAMSEVVRPDMIDYSRAVSAQKIAWKTGTSYGGRDAWAIGVTPKYAVGVWVGNCEGNGIASMTGAATAGPVMFDIFNALPQSGWFPEPKKEDGIMMEVCSHSGYPAGKYCQHTSVELVSKGATSVKQCPYCKEFRVSLDGQRLITDRSEPTVNQSYFVLPSLIEHYYKNVHPEYISLPPVKPSENFQDASTMELIYPKEGAVISLPVQLDGTKSPLVCKAVCSETDMELFWHMDNIYLGSTKDIHDMSINLTKGMHRLTIMDLLGNKKSVIVKVV